TPSNDGFIVGMD
ncbi:hypothetical protein D041_0798B, partial [Vibrio parahaemolyticus EKP-008]